MKKIISMLFISATISLVSCGPSAEEKARIDAEAKYKMDSIFEAASQSMVVSSDSVERAHDSINFHRTKMPKVEVDTTHTGH